MTSEELSLKLGIDGSGAAQTMRTMKGQISEFAESSGKAFTHGASAAKGFKAALHEIAETSPVMGAALKLAISPIGGIMIAATMAFSYFKNKIEETNKELDRLSELAAKPLGNMPEAMNKAREKLAELTRDQKKWWESVYAAQDDVTRGLKDHLDLMDEQSKINDKHLAQEKEKALYVVRANEAAGLLTPYGAAVQTQRIEQSFAKQNYDQQLSAEKARAEYLTKQAAEFETKRAEAEEKVLDLEIKQRQQAGNVTTLNLPGQLAALKDPAIAAQLIKEQDEAKHKYEQIQEGRFLGRVTPEREATVARFKQAYDDATARVDKFREAIKKTEDEIYQSGNADKNLTDELERQRAEYKKYEDARKSAEEGAKQAGKNVIVLAGQGAPFVAPVEPKKGMFNPTLEQFASTRNPNQRDARRAMQIPGLAIQARLAGNQTEADKLEAEYQDIMFGKSSDMAGATNTGMAMPGSPNSVAGSGQDAWNRAHGLAYHTGSFSRSGGLQSLLQGQRKDYMEELYKLIQKMSVKESRLRIEPALDN
jgi:hypothetical protein